MYLSLSHVDLRLDLFLEMLSLPCPELCVKLLKSIAEHLSNDFQIQRNIIDMEIAVVLTSFC